MCLEICLYIHTAAGLLKLPSWIRHSQFGQWLPADVDALTNTENKSPHFLVLDRIRVMLKLKKNNNKNEWELFGKWLKNFIHYIPNASILHRISFPNAITIIYKGSVLSPLRCKWPLSGYGQKEGRVHYKSYWKIKKDTGKKWIKMWIIPDSATKLAVLSTPDPPYWCNCLF